MTTVKFALLFLASVSFGQIPIRTFTVTTDVSEVSVPAVTPLRWFQGESLTFNHYSTASGASANWTNYSNLVGVWSVHANQTDSPDDANAYLWATGTVTAASGKIAFTVAPSYTAMPASNYWSFVTLYQTDASGVTNDYVGVVYRGKAQVLYRSTSASYVGPWEIPTNMYDGVARDRITTETNRAQVAESALGVRIDAFGASTNLLRAVSVGNDLWRIILPGE